MWLNVNAENVITRTIRKITDKIITFVDPIGMFSLTCLVYRVRFSIPHRSSETDVARNEKKR